MGEFRQSSLRDDLFGGLISASLAIPLSMGYGMFAFTALGDSYFAHGALAGLSLRLRSALFASDWAIAPQRFTHRA
jgi:MFS superfamily sulfate permease-like transporter